MGYLHTALILLTCLVGPILAVRDNIEDILIDVISGQDLVADPPSALIETSKPKSKCPKIESDGSGDMPNLVFVTIKSAKNLHSTMMDTIDPYIKFWAGPGSEGNTGHVNNNENPIYHWGCLMSYTGLINFDLEVWDYDTFSGDDFEGSTGDKQGVNINQFIEQFDTNKDGNFELTFKLYTKNQKPQMNYKKTARSTVTVGFQMIRDTKYRIHGTW